MREGWVTAHLRDFVALSRKTVPPSKLGDEPINLYSIPDFDAGKAPILTPVNTIKSGKLLIPEDAVLVSLLNPRIPRTLIARSGGYCSTEFAVLIPGNGILLEYLAILVSSRQFLKYLEKRAKGTTGSRKRVNRDALLEIRVALPPLDEQRRIVDLIGSVDDAIETAKESVVTSGAVLSELSRLPVPGVESDRLGNLVLMRSGPSWKSADERKTPIPGFVPVLGITNTPAGRALDLSDRRFVKSVPDSAQRLDESSIVMIRTNGNRSRIGNVYRAAKAVEGFAVSAFQIAIRPRDPADADFLYWYLGSPEVQDAITGNASGSTGLGNIAVGWLKQLSIPNLSAGDRSAYVARCGAADDVQRSAQASVSRLRDLRSNLLTMLLSGEHEIPESYDELIEEVRA